MDALLRQMETTDKFVYRNPLRPWYTPDMVKRDELIEALIEIKKEFLKQYDEVRKKEEKDGEQYNAIEDACPNFEIEEKYKVMTMGLDLEKASEMVEESFKCKQKLIDIMIENTDSFKMIYLETKKLFDEN